MFLVLFFFLFFLLFLLFRHAITRFDLSYQQHYDDKIQWNYHVNLATKDLLRHDDCSHPPPIQHHTTHSFIMTTVLYHDHACHGKDCRIYQTPMNECYNGQLLFPNDPSWGSYDIYDQWWNNESKLLLLSSNHNMTTSFQRTLYQSNDSSCHHYHVHDVFTLPWYECVGPFGIPRPWGYFLPPSSS
jgi:hypothetical protein